MKLVAVVVTYYPDLNEAIQNIKQYINYIDQLIIWENTPIKDRHLHKIELLDYDYKITYLGGDSNEGIAYALNRSIEWSTEKGYTHVLTMDQDSSFCNFEHYKNIVEKSSSEKDIAIYSPNVNKGISFNNDLKEVQFSITSGSIFNLDIFRQIGLFREDYFIDAVDFEFCFRAKRYKILTYIVVNADLNQMFGNLTKTDLGFHSNNYSAFRTFFIARNYIWMWREYPEIHSYSMFKYLFGETIFKRLLKIFLGESDKKKKYKALFKGIYFGLKYK